MKPASRLLYRERNTGWKGEEKISVKTPHGSGRRDGSRPGRETEKGLQEVNRESMEQSVQHEMFWLFHS